MSNVGPRCIRAAEKTDEPEKGPKKRDRNDDRCGWLGGRGARADRLRRRPWFGDLASFESHQIADPVQRHPLQERKRVSQLRRQKGVPQLQRQKGIPMRPCPEKAASGRLPQWRKPMSRRRVRKSAIAMMTVAGGLAVAALAPTACAEQLGSASSRAPKAANSSKGFLNCDGRKGFLDCNGRKGFLDCNGRKSKGKARIPSDPCIKPKGLNR
jgi:hypothetical protein